MINQTTKERREAYIEVLEILKHMDRKYVTKIPKDLIEFFERNSSKEYEFHIDTSIPLEEHKLKENTINILAMLNLNYWCESEEHKKELLKKYHENDLRHQEKLRNKYNTDNLFKRERKVITSIKENYENSIPLKYEEPKWYQKTYNIILKFIKRLFNKA